jgi:dinuclear metal center YbgI/SA1388 family protein
MACTVGDVRAVMRRHYPEEWAADWDAVGLVCGDPHASVSRILLAVDPAPSVVDEALLVQADMIITHHPLFLQGVHAVTPETAGGSVVHTLIGHGIALYCAHTNADHASPGVSDALATALGVYDTVPVEITGDAGVGVGRIGRVAEPCSLQEFAVRVTGSLPETVQGIRVAGDLDRVVRTVAVCGGAGDSLLAAIGSRADVYVTSDLRHHRAQDHLAAGGGALIDVAHWASEWPWLNQAAEFLRNDPTLQGVDVEVSTIVTDPWTATLRSDHES